jgi:RNA-directed DNA polymerase
MQRKIATWATGDKERKFDRLLRLIANRLWLREAANVTLAARGAGTPGIDGVDRDDMKTALTEQLEQIRSELLNGTYQPSPARRVYSAEKDRLIRRIEIADSAERDHFGTSVSSERSDVCFM